MTPDRIDWFRIFADLAPLGWNVARIATEIEANRTTVLNWKNVPGTQPRFSDGMALARLWCDLMNQPMDALPREKSGI